MITENDIRLIRQYLIADEEKRTEDAKAIWEYLTQERGLVLEECPRRDLTADMVKKWNVPESVSKVVFLVSYGREPVFRIPADLKTRAVSWAEVPDEVPEELKIKGM